MASSLETVPVLARDIRSIPAQPLRTMRRWRSRLAAMVREHQDASLLAVSLALFTVMLLSPAERSFQAFSLVGTVPIGLIAVGFGLRYGLAAAVAGSGVFALSAVAAGGNAAPGDYLAHAAAFVLVGGSLGYLSDLCYRAFTANRATSEQLAAVLDRAPILVYVKDRDGSFRVLNSGYDQPPQERSDNGGDAPLLPPPIAGDFHANDLTVLRTGVPVEVHETAPHADGPHSYTSTKYPLFDTAGVPYAVCSVSSDTTEHDRAEVLAREGAELRGRTDELERSNAELTHFAYAAAHDLSEPLRMVSSYLDLLSRRLEGRLGPDGNEYLHFALHGARRMQALLEGLLAYSTLDNGELTVARVDFRRLMEDVIANLRIVIADRNATVTFDPLPTVRGDPSQLASVLQNLVSNAIKFVATEAPRVHVSAQREQDAWRFTVTDNGVGVDPAQAERIFEMFRRLHRQEEYAGSGIGLALSKRIVERHGGRIWVEAAPEGGSRFCFTIADAPQPAAQREHLPAPAHDRNVVQAASAHTSNGDGELSLSELSDRRFRRPRSRLSTFAHGRHQLATASLSGRSPIDPPEAERK